jgi:HD-GYP domain-containing protein (c-di-GMP phosphodiesterase class II)
MVADVVEAMTSHRPYRPGLGVEAALAEIKRGSGGRYDRDVSEACARVFNEHGFAFTDIPS